MKYWQCTFLLYLFSSFVSLEAYTVISNAGNIARWSESTIPFRLHEIPSPFDDEIRQSFLNWESVPGVGLSFEEQKTTEGSLKNTIRWEENWQELPFHAPSNALAVTLLSFNTSDGTLSNADIHFNAQNFDWDVIDANSVEDYSDYVDVQNIATHEIGHFIGIDHSSESLVESETSLLEASMYFASGKGEVARRIPQDDDEMAVLGLYSENSLPEVRIERVEKVESSLNQVTYRVQGSGFNENGQTSFVLTRNDPSFSDAVARYREIYSSTEAEVEFDLSQFPNGTATLLAFNDVSQVASYHFDVTESNFEATEKSSSGGGGGCHFVAATGNASSVAFSFLVLVLLALFSLLGLRRSTSDLPIG